MKGRGLFVAMVMTVILLGIGGWLVYFFQLTGTANTPATLSSAGTPANATGPIEVAFNPPALEDAPENIRNAVMLGYKIMTETKKYAGEYIGNDLSCTNCHFDGGRTKDTISLVGVAAIYPHYRSRSDYSTNLTVRTFGCFQRSMNGSRPPADSKIMQALTTYYQWISKDIPIYAEVPWLGLPTIPKDIKGDKARGVQVYSTVCARCHGENGLGTDIAPPVWGPGSYNDGAGMSKIPKCGAFVWRFMPKSAPSLSQQEAMDVASYVDTQPRPHFGSKAAPATIAATNATN